MTRTLELCGANRAAFEDTASREYLLSGPAGSGKTLANLCKLLWFADSYPGARLLVVRKTRHSLTETALVTWERDVLGPGHPVLARRVDRGHRHAYRFPNRSVLVTGGMDNPDKVLSSEWDLVYCPEATELSLTDWETLGGRLRAMAGPFDQLMGDCNPGAPQHWLKRRCDGLACRLYESRHHDNPRYYDHRAGRWTEAGRRYVGGRLRLMTGLRRKRFYEGVWASAEGAVYAFDPGLHLLPAGWRPPADWPRVWAIDWGKTAPTVLQMWAVDGAGRMYLYREFFRTGTRPDLLGRWARGEVEGGREPRPAGVVCDHDPEAREAFALASGLSPQLADKADRGRGIEAVQARFDREGEGLPPRVFFAPDALAHPPDPVLEERGVPAGTLAELTRYVWDEDFLKDEPVAEHDHGMDALRYAERFISANAATLAGDNPYAADYAAAPDARLPAALRGR
jgi:phage terminase large subunit